MRNYKLVLLLRSELKKDEKQKMIDSVLALAGKAENTKTNDLGGKKLAYPIKGAKNGEYVVVEFDAEKINADFDKQAGIQEQVLRYLLVRTD